MKEAIIIAITFIALLSCRKDPVYQTPPQQGDKQLRVILHDDYLPSHKVDSAVVIWRVNGTEATKKLSKTAGFLVADISAFSTGNGEITVRIFSKNQLDGKSLMYERKQLLHLQPGITFTTTAPNDFDDVNWNPRIIFHHRNTSANFNITAFVGIRPNDPVFELKDINAAWRYKVILTRTYFHSNNILDLLGNLTWSCDNCLNLQGNYCNNSFFAVLPQQINNRQWNTASFTLRFYTSASNAGEVNFDHTFN